MRNGLSLRAAATALVVRLPLACALAVGSGLDVHADPMPDSTEAGRSLPKSGLVARGLRAGGLQRTYLTYAPADLPILAPLIVVLHGSGQTGQTIRSTTGRAFERLADRRGFAVAYPDAYRKRWNSTGKVAAPDARKDRVDDVAFLTAMIDQIALQHGVDLGRVFLFGYSNGGEMSFRMAQETPGRLAAIAAVAANLPADDAALAPGSGAVRAMIVSGTKDRIMPYDGGRVGLLGLGDQGVVRSAQATAEHFARLNGASLDQTTLLSPSDAKDPTRVARQSWRAGSRVRVVLYSVVGGGHVIPQPYVRASTLLGRQSTALDATEAAVDFFGLGPRAHDPADAAP